MVAHGMRHICCKGGVQPGLHGQYQTAEAVSDEALELLLFLPHINLPMTS